MSSFSTTANAYLANILFDCQCIRFLSWPSDQISWTKKWYSAQQIIFLIIAHWVHPVEVQDCFLESGKNSVSILYMAISSCSDPKLCFISCRIPIRQSSTLTPSLSPNWITFSLAGAEYPTSGRTKCIQHQIWDKELGQTSVMRCQMLNFRRLYKAFFKLYGRWYNMRINWIVLIRIKE